MATTRYLDKSTTRRGSIGDEEMGAHDGQYSENRWKKRQGEAETLPTATLPANQQDSLPSTEILGPPRHDPVTTLSHRSACRNNSALHSTTAQSAGNTAIDHGGDNWNPRAIRDAELAFNDIYETYYDEYDPKEKIPSSQHHRRPSSTSLDEDDGHALLARYRYHLSQFRKMLIFFGALLLASWAAYTLWYAPLHHEDTAVRQSVASKPDMDLTSHMSTSFEHLTLLKDLNPKHVPSAGQRAGRRLVLVGDVHGMKKELVKLLRKIDFDQDRDHLVLTGDMISKGPDSPGVVDLVMRLGASSVRGNHEDKVLLARRNMLRHSVDLVAADADTGGGGSEMRESSHSGEYRDRELARRFSPDQIAWLERCPVILRVGPIEGMGEVVVVHAGLVPGLALERQDAWFVMNMRSIDLKTWVPSNGRDGTAWNKLWNQHQHSLPTHQRSTVVYGHDSKRGLQQTRYSYGIDSGCLAGGRLTALIIEGAADGVTQKLVSIKCKAYK
ncbi:MAG: hypothetical protein M1818_007362 [Claussenomyces sp. TS43310]|nr:MAG: hypothetical protein M1818_007362 [Claussenomyces sp. TS43310]